MNRYSGNSGIVERIPEPGERLAPPETPHFERHTPEISAIPAQAAAPRPSSPFGGFSLANLFSGGHSGSKPPEQSVFGSLGGLFSKLSLESLEMEDYLLLGVLYLLYRESGDIEFLLIAGAMLLL